MIVVGYQGIGKSTLAGKECRFINLESSLFYGENGRIDDWYVYYCKIAESLSRQGYVVFVSSHKQVRDCLRYSDEKVVIICPDISLKEQWIDKLRERYDMYPSSKNLRAWQNTEKDYDKNINDLMYDEIPVITIKCMTYHLETLIENYDR